MLRNLGIKIEKGGEITALLSGRNRLIFKTSRLVTGREKGLTEIEIERSGIERSGYSIQIERNTYTLYRTPEPVRMGWDNNVTDTEIRRNSQKFEEFQRRIVL